MTADRGGEPTIRPAAIVLPPFVDTKEFDDLPEHERERLYLGESHELFCLYFGRLARSFGETGFRVKQGGKS